ncbi:hypothetical protein [Dokdonella sp.]|jgi:hypothetical protein|uniref:hypothetical protein n=1 Tax=Dokdonella sp. TaxID=2291710 RepID=UPI002F41AAA7
MNIMTTNIRLLGLSAALFAATAVVHAQTQSPAPAPATPPPVDTPPSTPPVNTATPPVDTTPPPVGTPTNDGRQGTNRQQDVPRDANGNPLPATNSTANAPPAAPQPLDFGMLDTDKAGSLKLEQARNDPWLRQHFADCDINHNDEVTQSEYEKCSRR